MYKKGANKFFLFILSTQKHKKTQKHIFNFSKDVCMTRKLLISKGMCNKNFLNDGYFKISKSGELIGPSSKFIKFRLEEI